MNIIIFGDLMQYVVFLLEEQQFGIELSLVERILSIVEVTPLPNAPNCYLGAVDIHGEIVPIVNLRKLMGIQDKEIELTDHLILCNFRDRSIALWADRVSHITTSSVNREIEKQVYSKVKGIEQAIEDNGKFIFVIDINQFLSNETSFAIPK